MHCTLLSLFNPTLDFLQAAKVTKSGHHLFHDQASEGYGSIPGLMSQTSLHACLQRCMMMQISLWRQIRNRPMPLTSLVVGWMMARFRNVYNLQEVKIKFKKAQWVLKRCKDLFKQKSILGLSALQFIFYLVVWQLVWVIGYWASEQKKYLSCRKIYMTIPVQDNRMPFFWALSKWFNKASLWLTAKPVYSWVGEWIGRF